MLVNAVTHTICEECFEKAMQELNSSPAKNNKPKE